MLEPSLRFLPMHTHLAHPTVRQQTLDIRLKRCQSGEFTSEYTVPYPSQGHFLHSCYQHIWGHPAHLDRSSPSVTKENLFIFGSKGLSPSRRRRGGQLVYKRLESNFGDSSPTKRTSRSHCITLGVKNWGQRELMWLLL